LTLASAPVFWTPLVNPRTWNLLVFVPACWPVYTETEFVHIALPDLVFIVLEEASNVLTFARLQEVAAHGHAGLETNWDWMGIDMACNDT